MRYLQNNVTVEHQPHPYTYVGAVLSQRNFFVEGEACGGTRRQAAIPDLGHFLHYLA
jgi:hypothetical protein